MIAASIVLLQGCGKKGPPLPPFVRVPAAVSQITVRRLADEVIVNLALPVQNIDESLPVSLGRIEIYAYTGRAAPPAPRFPEVATLVATIEAGGPATPVTTVHDSLTSDELVEGRPLPRPTPLVKTPMAAVEPPQGALKRYYMAIPFSERGRPGPPSPVVEIPLTALPDAPIDVRATYNAEAVTVSWDPSGGLLGFLLDAVPLPSVSPLDDGPPAAEGGLLPPGPTRYNVYREVSRATAAPGEGKDGKPAAARNGEPGGAKDGAPAAAQDKTPDAPPAPLNPMPIESLTFVDPLQGDGDERCYRVTAVRGRTDRAVEGRSSTAACVTPLDIFPPKPPTGISPIAVEGAISLVWEANSESDLQGYFVLRGTDGSETLTRITDDVVKETRYTDKTTQAGVRYMYAVVAVDGRIPEPNVSEESERVEVTAR